MIPSFKKKSPLILLIQCYLVLTTQHLYEVSALGIKSLFGGDTDEIKQLSDTVDVYKGNETMEVDYHYGVDISAPITSLKMSDNFPWLPHNMDPENNPVPDRYQGMPLQILGDRQKAYDELVNGCRKHYGMRKSACDFTERDRIEMNSRQPSGMQNYTELGFKKIKAPAEVFDLIKDFWELNKDQGEDEKWNAGNTYTNHWVAPTKMVSVENTKLRGGGSYLKNKIWNLAKQTLQEWTGQELTPCSLYGIRVYYGDSVLATHVDRMPLVSSAILNVAQDVDEPWPIEVYAHDGRAYNVTMEPGDMILYESHSVLHGRPFALKGRFYANIFIHFEPVGHSLRHNSNVEKSNVDSQYREALAKGHGGHEHATVLPSYIVEGSNEASRWKSTHNEDWEPAEEDAMGTTGSTDAHSAANTGDVDSLNTIAKREKELLTQKDVNGWEPIHEGARGGHTDVLKLLVEHGANINERTDHGRGGSPLYLAIQGHGKRHTSVKYLQSIGAELIEPEL